MFKLLVRSLFFIFIIAPINASLIKVDGDGVHYYCIGRNDVLPDAFIEPAKKMYFESYDPSLHEGKSLQDMGLSAEFTSYEDFLWKLIDKDFNLYKDWAKIYLNQKTTRLIYFATIGPVTENFEKLLGLCALIDQSEGHYYVDHIGIEKSQQFKGFGQKLYDTVLSQISNFKRLYLDTREFNAVAQKFYEKNSFEKVLPHPIKEKREKYFMYEIRA